MGLVLTEILSDTLPEALLSLHSAHADMHTNCIAMYSQLRG